MDVAVLGANGGVGRKLLPLLADSGHRIRALVRDPAQAPGIEERGAEPVEGDLEGEFAHVLDGCSAVVFTAGSGGHTGADKTATVDGLGAILAVNETLKREIRRFVMISARSADDPDRSRALKHYLVAKLVADEYLARSGLDYTIVRPGTLTDEPPTGRIRIGPVLGRGTVTRGDVAATVAEALKTPATIGSTFELLNDGVPIDEALASL